MSISITKHGKIKKIKKSCEAILIFSQDPMIWNGESLVLGCFKPLRISAWGLKGSNHKTTYFLWRFNDKNVLDKKAQLGRQMQIEGVFSKLIRNGPMPIP